MKKGVVLIFLVAILHLSSQTRPQLKVVQEWKILDYKFPNETERELAIKNRQFIPGRPFPLGVDVHYKKGENPRYFVTTPFGRGTPISLGTISGPLGTPEAVIEPYPDYSWHYQRNNCSGMITVTRIAIDKCSRLWALDTGNQACGGQLLAFDLNTDKLILRHRFTDTYLSTSLLVTPIVDVRDDKCENTFVYIADASSYAIIVFDVSANKSWRVEDGFTYPHPGYGTYTIAGVSFSFMDGVIGMALSPFKNKEDDRTLYFHAFASNTENIVKTSSLRNETLWSDNDYHPEKFKQLDGRRPTQAAVQAIDKNGIIYFGLIGQNSIACWNTAVPFGRKNIHTLVKDDEALLFVSGIKIVDNLKGEQELLAVTSPFQKIRTGTRNNTEINYRIMSAPVKDLLRNSKCARPNALSNSYYLK